jgi:hypothetical protein
MSTVIHFTHHQCYRSLRGQQREIIEKYASLVDEEYAKKDGDNDQ